MEEWVDGTAERAEFDDRNDVLRLYNRPRESKPERDHRRLHLLRHEREVARCPARPRQAGRAQLARKVITAAEKAAEGEKADKAPPLQLRPETGTR